MRTRLFARSRCLHTCESHHAAAAAAQARYLPHVNPSNPGKLMDFVAHRELVGARPTVFGPLRGAFGCDFARAYDGVGAPACAAASSLARSH